MNKEEERFVEATKKLMDAAVRSVAEKLAKEHEEAYQEWLKTVLDTTKPCG